MEIWFRGDDGVTAPNIVYVPAAEDYIADYAVSCDGLVTEVDRDETTGKVAVPCNGEGAHYIRVGPL